MIIFHLNIIVVTLFTILNINFVLSDKNIQVKTNSRKTTAFVDGIIEQTIENLEEQSKFSSENRILQNDKIEKDDPNSTETAKGYKWIGGLTIQQVLDRTQGKGQVSEKDVIFRSHIIHNSEKFFYDFTNAFIEHSEAKINIKKNWLSSKLSLLQKSQNNQTNYETKSKLFEEKQKQLPPQNEYYYKPFETTETPIKLPEDFKTEDINKYRISGANLSLTGLDWTTKMVYYDNSQNQKFIGLSHIYQIDSKGKVKKVTEGKEPEYQEVTYEPELVNKMDLSGSKNNCEKFYFLKDLRISVFICKDGDNRWYILIKCSDSSCNDRKEILKISENRRDKTTSLQLKIMPGVSGSSSLTIFTFFPGDVLLEEASIDHVGQYTSRIHVLERKLHKIRFFAGQLLIFEFFEKGIKSFYYKVNDFGQKYDFKNLIKMKDMGTFVNSYNTKEFSDLVIETFDKENNILSLKFNRDTEQFTIETTMETNFPKNFNPGEITGRNFVTYIFEMGDYKVMVSAKVALKEGQLDYEDIVYNLIFKGRVLKITNETKQLFFESVFSKVSGLDKLAAIDYKISDIKESKLKVVQFHRPILKIDGSFGLLKEEKKLRRMLLVDNKFIFGSDKEQLEQQTENERILQKESLFQDNKKVIDKASSVEIFGEEKDKEGVSKSVKYMKIETTFSDSQLGTAWLMPKIKYGKITQNEKDPKDPKNEETVAYLDIKSHNLSDMIIKMHKVARGSFLSIIRSYPIENSKQNLKNENTNILLGKSKKTSPTVIDYTNKVNPLFSYKHVSHLKEIKANDGSFIKSFTIGETLIQTGKLINIINRGPEIQKHLILASDKNNFNISKFEVHSGNLVKIWEKNQLVDPEEIHIFNETMIIIKDKNTLWSYDILEDRKIDHIYEKIEEKIKENQKSGKQKKIDIPDGGKLKETLFEKNKCSNFMLIRHQYIDVTFWCKDKKNLNAYYAREVLSGKVGLSNIKLNLPKDFDWSKVRLRYTDYFQDIFYALDEDFKLHIFKIDAKYYIKVIKIHTVDLKIRMHKLDHLQDFKFIEDKLVVYTDTRLGWDSQIVLNFYHFKDAISPIHTKKIVLDPSFSPDKKEPLLFRFQSIRSNIYKEKYVFMPMLALKVKHHHLYDNVLFINPALEYHQAIPSVLFPLESKVFMKIGFSVNTGTDTWEQSIMAVYQNFTASDQQLSNTNIKVDLKSLTKSKINGENIKISVIDADQLRLRLFETSSTDITDMYKSKDSQKAQKIVISQYNSTNKILREKGIEIHVNYAKGVLNKQLIEFTHKEITLDLNKQNFETSLLKHKTLAYKIDTFDKIKGNVFKFNIEPESPLEHVSEIIKLQSHVQYIGINQKTTKNTKKSASLFDFERFKDLTSSLGNKNQNVHVEKNQINQNNGLVNPLISNLDDNSQDKRLLYDPYYLDNGFNSSCSSPVSLYMNSLIRNQTTYQFRAFFDSENFYSQKDGLYIEQYQIWACKSSKNKNYADLYIRGLWKNKTLHTQKFENVIQNMFILDYNDLKLNYYDYILTLTAHAKSNRRPIYVDLYYLDIFTALNKTVEVEIDTDIMAKFPIVEDTKDPKQIKINDNLRLTARRYQMLSSLDQACFNNEIEFENLNERETRLNNCLEVKKQFLEYKVHIKFLKRENFKLSEHDYLLRVNIANGDFKTGSENFGLTPEKRDVSKDYLSIQFVTFQISKNIYSEYIIKINNDFIRLNYQKFGDQKTPNPSLLKEGTDYTSQNGILDVLSDDRKYIKQLTIDQNYAKEHGLYIYDDVKYRIVKKDQLDIWMVLESKDANNYIIRYPKELLLVDKTKPNEIIEVKNVKPLSWRIDNPYFGKANGASMQPQMSDWLYVLPKNDADETHFIFYVIPEEKMIEGNGEQKKGETEKDKSIVLYSKRVLVLENVLGYTIKRLDFKPEISTFNLKKKLSSLFKNFEESQKKKQESIISKIDLNKETGIPTSILSCLPYTTVPKATHNLIDPQNIEQYTVNFKHKNNTYTTFMASKYLKVEIKNAFLSSKYINFYAITSLHQLDLKKSEEDKRYFSKQLIKLQYWQYRNPKKFMIAVKLLIAVVIALMMVLFAFIALRKQEIEAEQRIKKERERNKIGKLIGKMGVFVNKIGREQIEKENKLNNPEFDDNKPRQLKKINLGGLLDEIGEKGDESEDEEDLNQVTERKRGDTNLLFSSQMKPTMIDSDSDDSDSDDTDSDDLGWMNN